MLSIFLFLYLLFFLGLILLAVFVLYHFLQYSFSKTRGYWTVGVFLAGFLPLLMINIFSFLNSLQILNQNSSPEQSSSLPIDHSNTSPW